MAEPPAAGAGKETKDKKEAKRLEEEEKRQAKLREETVKREAKQKEKEAKEREKEKEKEQKRLEKEAKEQEAREKELKRKEAKQKEEEAKREAKLKKEEAEREKKLKEKMEKLEKAKKGKSPREDKVRRHSKYRLSGGSTSGVDGSAKVIGSPLALVMHTKPDGSTELPQLFVAGINFLQDHLNTEGLFRISGSMQEINTWRAELDSGRELTFNPNTNPHSVAGILKLFLRELPEPLFTFSLYADWCTVAETPVANKQQRLQLIAEMLPKMPKANLLLLTELIRLLSAVVVFSAQNKMTSANLGLVFGPNVMRGPDEGSMNLMYTCDVISFLIDNSAAFISIAGGGAAIVETGEVAEAEEQAEAEPTEEDAYDASVDGSQVGSQVGGSQVGGGSHRSETSPIIASAPPAASEQGMPPLTLLPPPMDAPPPPPEEL